MENQAGIKKYVPGLIALGLFLVVSALFCLPVINGQSLVPHDTISWLYMSKEARDSYAQTGQVPFWANNMFGGMPQVFTFMVTPGNWMNILNRAIFPDNAEQIANPIPFFLWAMINFYLLLRVLKVNNWLSIGGAVAFAFSSYIPIIIAAGHNTKVESIAFLPGVVAGVLLVFSERKALGLIVFGVTMAILLDVWHIQIIYYIFILLGVLFVYLVIEKIKNGQLKSAVIATVLLAVISGICFSMTATRILWTKEYSEYSTRGGKSELTINKNGNTNGGLNRDYAFQWSNGIGETFCILVPNLYGGGNENIGEDSHFGQALSEAGAPENMVEQYTANAPTYWGPQPFLSGPIYFGAVVCFLFVLAFFIVKSKIKWGILGLSLFFILLSLGKNLPGFNNWMFDHLPLYNKFRTPSMALSVPLFLFPLLGFLALKDIFADGTDKEIFIRKTKIAFYVVGGLILVILLAAQFSFDYHAANDESLSKSFGESASNLLGALRKDRASLAFKDCIRSLILVALGFAVLWAYLKNKLTKQLAMTAIILLVAIDEIPVAHRYLNKNNFMDVDELETTYFSPTPADQQILQDKTLDYRVLDLASNTFNDAKPSYFHKTIGGYSPAKLQIYQDLIDMQIGKLNHAVLNMLNTKYIIVPNQGQNAQQQGGGAPQVIPNQQACGNAWFVSEVKPVATADQEITALNAPAINDNAPASQTDFDPLKTAVMQSSFARQTGQIGKDPNAAIRMTSYSCNKLTYESSNNQNGLAVFSEIYYPAGWTATIDGKEVPILKANYALRALSIPAGKHNIEFNFHPKSYDTGNSISLIGSVLLTIIIIAALFFLFKNRENKGTASLAQA